MPTAISETEPIGAGLSGTDPERRRRHLRELGWLTVACLLWGWFLNRTSILQDYSDRLLHYSEHLDEVLGTVILFAAGFGILAWRWRSEARILRLAALARANEVLRAEVAERQRAEARFRGTLDSMMEGGQIIGRDWRYLYVNEVAARHGRRAAADLVGRTMMECYPEIESAPMFAAVRRCMEGGPPEEIESNFSYPDGARASFQLAIQAVPEGVFILSLDVTQQRKLEEQVRQAQKMEAIGTLAGGIAHDFNNILAVINGYAELLKLSLPDEPDAREHLEAIAQAGKRATSLVRQILTFSRREETQRQVIDLAPVVREAMKFLRSTIPATIEIHTVVAGDSPVVLADATQVHQIVMNLGTNAWHAMRGRAGRLEVRLEPFEVEAALAETQPRLRPGPYARLSLTDTGKGMDQATLARIFEPFFTTKPVGEGTGLGLSVVHGIMQSHDGLITVYSEPGRGTTFQLYFPADPGGAAAAAAPLGEVPRGRGERILYVDDEVALARMGQKFLERLGYAVEAQTDVMAALELVRSDPGRFALVITAQAMPGMTGTDFAEELRQIRPDLPVILTTGYLGPVRADQLGSMGIRALLPKPPTIRSVGLVVQRVLAEREAGGP